MITDDDLDRRLADAGNRWRAAHDRPADVAIQVPRRRTAWLAAAAAVVVALAVALPVGLTRGNDGGTDAGGHGGPALTGTTWQLVSADGHPNQARDVTLHITRGQVDFDDGVNGGSGPVRVDGDELHFGDIAVGAVGGTGSDPIAPAVDDTLSGTARLKITDDRLTITKGSHTLVYEVQPTPQQVLTGRTWRLTAGSTFEPGQLAVPLDVSFTGGQYELSAQCTRSAAGATAGITVELGATTIRFAQPAVDVCPTSPPGWAGEFRTVAGALDRTVSWTIDQEGRLVLDGNDITLTFVAR